MRFRCANSISAFLPGCELDPRIHRKRVVSVRWNRRVKPGNDDVVRFTELADELGDARESDSKTFRATRDL